MTLASVCHNLVCALKKTLLIKWETQPEIVLAIYCIGAVMKVKPVKGTSWFHHLILIFLTGFAGGTITPMMLGKPPMLFTNDLIIPFTCAAWYLVHHTSFEKVLSKKQVKYPILVIYEISRANGVMKIVSMAESAIAPSYFHTPIVGPVVIGTLYGCLGAFLPFDRGLAYIEDGVPQNIEVAFIGALFYHLAVYDPTLLGAYIRGLPLLSFNNPDNVKVFIVLFFITMSLSLAHYGPSYDLLRPLHSFLYQVSGLPAPGAADSAAATSAATTTTTVKGGATAGNPPKKPEEESYKKFANMTRILVPVLAILVHLLFNVTKELVPGKSLAAGQYVSSCNRLDVALKGCKQHILAVEPDGGVAVYQGTSLADASKVRLWSAKVKKGKSKLSDDGYYLELSLAGILELRHKDSADIFWSSPSKSKGPPAAGKGKFSARVGQDGKIGVFNHSVPVWSS